MRTSVATRKKVFSLRKEVRAIARERVGTPPAARPLDEKPVRRKPKHKKKIDEDTAD